MSAQPAEPPGGFREEVDWRTGTISAAGRLTPHGADLIRGAARSLCRSGHARITVDLHAVRFADDEALAALRNLAAGLRARSWELVVLSEDNPS